MSQISDARLDGEVIRPAYYVQIAGFATRFYSLDAPPADSDYTDVRSVVSVGGVKSKLDAQKGVVTHSPVDVEIVDDKMGGAIASAARDMRRLRYDGADRNAYLVTTIEATGTADVEIDRDHAAWPATGYLHVGQECLEYTGKAGTGGPGDAWRFTGITRGALGTLQRQHIVDARQAWAPVVTSHIVGWRTRPCVIYVRGHRPNGGAGGWVEWMAGFIDASPEVQTDAAITIRLRVVPWDALIVNGRIGGDELAFGLAQGYHLFTAGICDRITMLQQWRRGEAVTEIATASVLAGSGHLYCATLAYDDVFDLTLTAGEPRRPEIAVSLGNVESAFPDAILSSNEFDMPAAYPAVAITVPPGSVVTNVATSELYQAKVTTAAEGDEELVEWPREALERINQDRAGGPPAEDAWGWGGGTNKGDNGIWARARVDEFNADYNGPTISVQLNSRYHAGSLDVWFSARSRDGHRDGIGYLLRITDAADAAAQDESDDARFHLTVSGRRDDPADRVTRAIAPIPIAAYARGEPVMLIDRLTVATGKTWDFAVVWTEVDGKEQEWDFRGQVTGDVTNVDGEVVGYRLELEDVSRVVSFGDWPGFPSARIRPVAAWRGMDPRTIIAELLVSVEGAGVNSAYDVLPFGLGIPEDHVDITQIVTHPIPPTAARWTVAIRKPSEIGKVIGPMLRAMGSALVMAIDPETGQRRIRLTQTGLAASTDSMATLSADKLVVQPWGTTSDESIANSWILKLRTVRQTEYTATWTDRDSVLAHGGEVRTAEEDLSTLDMELARDGTSIAAQLRPTLNEWRALYAWPRKLLAGSALARHAWFLEAGDVVLLSTPHAVEYDGTVGVSAIPVRVSEVSHDLERASSRLVVSYHGGRGTGWAPSLRVETVVSATAVTVEANAYTDAQHRITGAAQQDLDYWSVGQDAMMVPIGAWSGTTREITAIDTGTRQVDLDGAHGLSVGDSIDPVSYASAPAAHQGYAYLADTDELIDGTVAARTYV